MKRDVIHKNLTGNTATELTSRHDSNNDFDVYSMLLANIHASDVVTFDLYIQRPNAIMEFKGNGVEPINGDWTAITKTYTTIYLLKSVDIDAGNTLVLDSNEIEYDSTTFDLYIKLNNSDSKVDIIINKKLN